MNILSSLEEQTHDEPPRLNSAERKIYFHLPKNLRSVVTELRNPTNRVCFVLACGYFRAARRFFSQSPHPRDLEYVCAKLGDQPEELCIDAYHRATAMRHRRLILSHYGFQEFDQARGKLETEIASMVRSQLKPRLIFHRAVDILTEQKVALPSSDALGKLILEAINHRRQELVKIIDQNLSDETRGLLDQLLEKVADDGDEPSNRFQLTLLKRCSQSTKPGKIKESVSDLESIRSLQERVRPMLEKLGLSHEGISYYANTVIRSNTFDVTRRTEEDRYLHLIAFITHQFYRLHDNLIDVLLTTTQSAVQRQLEFTSATIKIIHSGAGSEAGSRRDASAMPPQPWWREGDARTA